MSDDEDVKKEVKEDHINIKVRDMVRRREDGAKTAKTRAGWMDGFLNVIASTSRERRARRAREASEARED